MGSLYDFGIRYGVQPSVLPLLEAADHGCDLSGRKLRSDLAEQAILHPSGSLPPPGSRKRYPFKNLKARGSSRLEPVSRYGDSGEVGYYHKPAEVPWTCFLADENVPYSYICQKINPETGKVRTVRVKKDPAKVKARNKEYRQWLKVRAQEKKLGKEAWKPIIKHRVQFTNTTHKVK